MRLYKVLKIFGLERCEHCGKIFTKWDGKRILEVHKQTSKLKWFCNEHAPSFDVCLNIYNSHLDYNSCIKCVINPNNYEISLKKQL